jgi:methionine-gamma-lyase
MIREESEFLETRLVHAGREDLSRLGVHAPPLDLSSTYPLSDLDEAIASFDALSAGAADAPSPVYARMHNPTVARYESALAGLEGAPAAVAFSSGMAAITALLLAATAPPEGEGAPPARRHVVAVRPLYGGTDHLLASGLLGARTDFVAEDEVGDAIRPDTALVLLETPGNPTLDLVDIAAVVRSARGVPVAVDSTFMTPVLQRPLEHGAAFVVHSATKFLGGHGDVLGGIVACDERWAARLRQVRIATGANLHPLAAFLLHRGLPTLALRVRAAESGARVLAPRLAAHPAVSRVAWPGLPETDPRGLVGRQMEGPGSMLAFELTGGLPAASRLLSELKLVTPAVSLGASDTLIQHPAGLTHRGVEAEARRRAGITPGLVRLSVGLEHPEDLWRDLAHALDRVAVAAMPLTEAPALA